VQKVVELAEGLNLTHFTKIAQGVLNPDGVRSVFANAILERLKQTAIDQGKGNVVYDVNKAASKRRREKEKNQTRQYTILKSSFTHVDLRPQVDSDKMYFLNEFLKLLAFSENYHKIKEYVGFYNSGLVIAFMCV